MINHTPNGALYFFRTLASFVNSSGPDLELQSAIIWSIMVSQALRRSRLPRLRELVPQSYSDFRWHPSRALGFWRVETTPISATTRAP